MIFVVDDSVTMVMSLKSTLALNGFQAESAGNRRKALDKLQAGFKRSE
jgi:two-component system chemotaxis response regulator CheY